MCNGRDDEYTIVEEVGVFGEMGIDNPYDKKVKDKSSMTEEEIDAVLNENMNRL